MQNVALVCALAAYTAGSWVQVQLPRGRAVSPIAAFAPLVFLLSESVYGDGAPLWLVLAAVSVVEVVVGCLLRRPAANVAINVCLLAQCSVAIAVAAPLLARSSNRVSLTAALVVIAAICSAVMSLADAVRHKITSGVELTNQLRAELPLYSVLLSTACLGVLVYPLLGWLSFPMLVLILLVTKREYANFAVARATYEDSIRALGHLTEIAGLVPVGHHEEAAKRVADLAAEARLDPDRARALELVALMQRAGAVALNDHPSQHVSTEKEIADKSAEILEATGDLEECARWLRLAASDDLVVPLEARILRAASGRPTASPLSSAPAEES